MLVVQQSDGTWHRRDARPQRRKGVLLLLQKVRKKHDKIEKGAQGHQMGNKEKRMRQEKIH